MIYRSLGRRAPLLWLVLPFIAGIVIGRYGPSLKVGWLLASALGAVGLALTAAWRMPRWSTLPLAATLLFAGDASYTLRRAWLAGWASLPAREARLSLRINRVFASDDPRKLSGLAGIVQAGVPLAELTGQRIYFSLSLRKGAAPPIRSTVITAVGVLTPLPESPPNGSFESYLADAGINFRLVRARLIAIEQPPTRYRRFCDRLAQRLNVILSMGVAPKRPELTVVYRAMMLGQKHDLSFEQNQLFMHSGTMHLFAINGLHIGIVAMALHALLLLARCPRLGVAILTLLILWIDVDTTGGSPSALRAWLLVLACESALVLRLPGNGLAALATAALLVLLVEPMAVFSASFQMSYGVVFAILCFGLPLAERLAATFPPWPGLPELTWRWWQRWIANALRWFWPGWGLGLAACLVGAVTGATFYGVFAPGGLIANLILVPLAMVVIIAGFASIAFGLVGALAVSAFLNHAAVLVLLVIDALIRVGQHVPGIWWAAQWKVPWVGTATLVVLLAVMLGGYARGWQGWARGFWPPFAVVTLALIFGVKFG